VSNPSIAAVFESLPGASFTVNGAAIPQNSALMSAGAELFLAANWCYSPSSTANSPAARRPMPAPAHRDIRGDWPFPAGGERTSSHLAGRL
jgi:hypothetical protein